MGKVDFLQSATSKSVEGELLELNISKKRLLLIYIFIGILFLIPNLFSIFWAVGWDDSIYMGAIRMVLEGKLPYRDFFWNHTPGFLYLNGLIAYIFNLDLIPLRLLSFSFGISGMILLGLISYRLGGHMGSIIVLSLSAATYLNSDYLSAIYFSSMANFFLLTSLALQLYLKDSYFKIFLITGALMLSFSIRSTNMICIFIYGFFLLLSRNNVIKKLIIYFFSFILFGILVYGYFLISCPGELIKGLTAARAIVYPSWGLQFNLAGQIFLFFYIMSDYSILFVSILLIVLFSFFDKNKKLFNFIALDKDKEESFIALVSLLLIALALFEIIFMSYPTMHHILYYFPLMTILIAWYYKPCLIIGLHGPKETRRLTILLIVISIFASYLTGPTNLFVAIRTIKKEYHYSSTRQIKIISQQINKATNPEDRIFTFNPVFAVYADRKLLVGLDTGYVAYSSNWQADDISRYHVYNFQKIKEWFESKSASIVILTDLDKKMAPFQEGKASGSGMTFWKDFYYYLNQNYKILFTEKIDSYFWGNCFVYVPK